MRNLICDLWSLFFCYFGIIMLSQVCQYSPVPSRTIKRWCVKWCYVDCRFIFITLSSIMQPAEDSHYKSLRNVISIKGCTFNLKSISWFTALDFDPSAKYIQAIFSHLYIKFGEGKPKWMFQYNTNQTSGLLVYWKTKCKIEEQNIQKRIVLFWITTKKLQKHITIL